MLSDLIWYDLEDALIYNTTEFDFAHRNLRSLEWSQYDSRGLPFLIGVRFDADDGNLVFSWGWEQSTLHDAVVWSSRPEGGMPVLLEQLKNHIRRVAGFGQYELKRRLEQVELQAGFARVATEWNDHFWRGSEQPPQLETENFATNCTLRCGNITVCLQQQDGAWFVEVTEDFKPEPEKWYFREETVTEVSKTGVYYVHSSKLTEELLSLLSS